MDYLNIIYNTLSKQVKVEKEKEQKEETKPKEEETPKPQTPVVEDKTVEPEKILDDIAKTSTQNMLVLLLKNKLNNNPTTPTKEEPTKPTTEKTETKPTEKTDDKTEKDKIEEDKTEEKPVVPQTNNKANTLSIIYNTIKSIQVSNPTGKIDVSKEITDDSQTVVKAGEMGSIEYLRNVLNLDESWRVITKDNDGRALKIGSITLPSLGAPVPNYDISYDQYAKDTCTIKKTSKILEAVVEETFVFDKDGKLIESISPFKDIQPITDKERCNEILNKINLSLSDGEEVYNITKENNKITSFYTSGHVLYNVQYGENGKIKTIKAQEGAGGTITREDGLTVTYQPSVSMPSHEYQFDDEEKYLGKVTTLSTMPPTSTKSCTGFDADGNQNYDVNMYFDYTENEPTGFVGFSDVTVDGLTIDFANGKKIAVIKGDTVTNNKEGNIVVKHSDNTEDIYSPDGAKVVMLKGTKYTLDEGSQKINIGNMSIDVFINAKNNCEFKEDSCQIYYDESTGKISLLVDKNVSSFDIFNCDYNLNIEILKAHSDFDLHFFTSTGNNRIYVAEGIAVNQIKTCSGNDIIINDGYIEDIEAWEGNDVIINYGIVGDHFEGYQGDDKMINYGFARTMNGGEDDDFLKNYGYISSGMHGSDGGDTIANLGFVDGRIDAGMNTPEVNDFIVNSGIAWGISESTHGLNGVLSNTGFHLLSFDPDDYRNTKNWSKDLLESNIEQEDFYAQRDRYQKVMDTRIAEAKNTGYPTTDGANNIVFANGTKVKIENAKCTINDDGSVLVKYNNGTVQKFDSAGNEIVEKIEPKIPEEPTVQSTPLDQINKLLGTDFTNENAVITTDSNNKITNIKQYSQETSEVINDINLYYDSNDNVALYIQNDAKAESTVFNGIVNKDGTISYTPYSEEYLSQIDSYKYPALTQTLEATAVKIAETISETDFTGFTLIENLTEDDAKYDLYQKESTVTIDDIQCKVIEYKSTMYSLSGEAQETLYYKEIYDENWTKISELAELYDNNGDIISAKSIINYTENGIALTKQVKYENETAGLKSNTTVSWNPEDPLTNKCGDEGYTGLKPIKIYGNDDDTPIDKTTQKINELKEQLKAKQQQQSNLLDEINDLGRQIEELEDELFDLHIELSTAYCESFSDIARTVRPYKEVLAEVNAKEAEYEALNEQLDDLYDQYNSLNSEIDSLEKQISDYGHSETAKDFRIDDFEQGSINDCYLLSELKSRGNLEDTDILKWNDDGSVDVNLYKISDDGKCLSLFDGTPLGVEIGDRETVHITAEQLANDTIDINGKTFNLAKGDLTVKAIEIANAQINGGDAHNIISASGILDGKLGYNYSAGFYGEGALDGAKTGSLLKNDNTNNEYYAKNLGTTMDSKGNLTINDVNGNPVTIFNEHAYQVSYNKADNTVTVTNPHDTANKNYTFDENTFKTAFSITTSNQQSTAKTLWKMWTR